MAAEAASLRTRARPTTIALALGGLGLAAATIANPFPYVADDALFYLVIGRNVADGHGITFSQVVPTNGFQPLWQAVVALLVWLAQLVGIDGDRAQLRIVVIACWACLIGGIALVDRILRRLSVGDVGRTTAAAIALVILGGPYSTLATEASLVYLLAAALLLAIDAAVETPAHGTRSALLVGALAGLLLLARVDTMFLVAAALTAFAWRLRGQGRSVALRSAAIAAASAGVVVAPYLAWNQVRFGRLLPISGAVKLRLGQLNLDPESVGREGWLLLAGAVALGIGATLARRREPFAWPWLVATIGSAGAAGWYFAFSTGQLTRGGWYHAPYVLALALGAALAVQAVLDRVPALAPAVAIGAALVLFGAVAFSWTERTRGANADQADAVLAFGAQARAALPADAVLATVDYPGYVALVTRHPTVALDGLTGDFELQRDLRDLGAACTLERLGVSHVVTDAPGRLEPVPGDPGRKQQQVASWLYDAPAGAIVLDERLVTSAVGLQLWSTVATCP